MVWLVSKVHLRFQTTQNGRPIPEIPVFFINLDRRPDRRVLFEQSFGEFGLAEPIRVAGVEHVNPMIGCSLAHREALNEAKKMDAEMVIIAEDDVVMRCDPHTLHAAIDEFWMNSRLDVLCIGNRVKGFLFSISDNLAVSNDIQTTSLYAVKRTALTPLIQSMEESAEMLALGLPWSIAAPDTHWKKLQLGKLVFAVPLARCATQRAGYSDIAGANVAYRV